jgi:Protein of unknown function with HXXEE motif
MCASLEQNATTPNARVSFDPVWLFPTTYGVHLLEEYFVGGGFPVWAQRVLGIQFSNREFVVWNAFAFALICLGALLVSRHARFRFIEIGMAIAVLGNVVAHVVGSLATWTYSPGLITGVFAWIPLASVRLQAAFRASSRRGRVAGTCIGVFVTVVILAVLASQLWTRADEQPRDQRRDPGVRQTPL